MPPLTLKMEAACSFKASATEPMSKQRKYPREESTSTGITDFLLLKLNVRENKLNRDSTALGKLFIW
jgi:hypothetical protein